MKKHPVDDLFRNKLSELEKQPSSDAWNRIRRAQDAGQKKLPVWIWYVAAGLALALLAGYSVWFNESGSQLPKMAKVELTEPPVEERRKINPVTLTEKFEKQAQMIADTKAEGYSSRIPRDLASTVSKVNDEEKQISKTPINEVPVQLAENQPASVAQVDIPNAVILKELIKENQPVTKSENNANRTIVVNVTYEDDSLEEPKTSRFTRVFRQLKNARAGEHVDWEEVGFNPKSVLARVDSKRKQ